MNSQPALSYGLMYHLVIVRPEPPGQFTAQPLGVPEIRVVAPTAHEAVEQARKALTQWLGSLHWVPVQVPLPQDHPWQQVAGHAKEDPEFELYLEEMAGAREESEVIAFAAEQGISSVLPAVLEMTQRVFPGTPLRVAIEEDPEIANDRHLVVQVKVPHLEVVQALEARYQWHRELFACCPAPLVCTFRLGLELNP
jgi:hypothetical protein